MIFILNLPSSTSQLLGQLTELVIPAEKSCGQTGCGGEIRPTCLDTVRQAQLHDGFEPAAFFFSFFVGARLIINISVADISCLTSLENSSPCAEPISFEERWEQVLERRRWMGEKKGKEKGRGKKKKIHIQHESHGASLSVAESWRCTLIDGIRGGEPLVSKEKARSPRQCF